MDNPSRNLQNWEVREYENLLQTLASQQVNLEEDRIVWNLEKSGRFSVKSYYSHLTRTDHVRLLNFLARQIWKAKVLPRIGFFCMGSLQEVYIDYRQMLYVYESRRIE